MQFEGEVLIGGVSLSVRQSVENEFTRQEGRKIVQNRLWLPHKHANGNREKGETGPQLPGSQRGQARTYLYADARVTIHVFYRQEVS